MRSPRSLLIFEAVVRTGSCTAAARAFNLTQPSVSRNIAHLESALGVALFLRRPTGLEPTPEGMLLYRAIAEGLERIGEAVDAICQPHLRRQAVVLSLSTAFVTHWFVPRMRAFNQAFPDVDLRFELTSGALRGPPGNVDLAMRRTPTCETDDYICPFMPEVVLPVCSQAYLERHGTLGAEGPITSHVLLELTETEIGWRLLLGARSEPLVSSGRWFEFSDYAVVLQTAIGGQGIALGWISAVSRLIAGGTLVPASRLRLETGAHFSLISPRTRSVRPIVHRIRDWMVDEMQREYRALLPLIAEAEPAAAARRARRPTRAAVVSG
ncbi:MAG: LysR family transcriptional regulator [Hyphomicrobiaceae bacterium]